MNKLLPLQNQYDVNYFISKFEAIGEMYWTTGRLSHDNKMCVLGFCGAKQVGGVVNLDLYPEAISLYKLVKKHLSSDVFTINDNGDNRYQQTTPKQRIIAALYDIKKMQEPKKQQPIPSAPEVKTVIRYVAVDSSIKEQVKELIEN